MDTRRVLSNISFNSPMYFAAIIQQLYNEDKLDWCYWIIHQPDKDDRKEHIHFCFQPSRTINTKKFNRNFYQWDFVDIDRPDKGIINWIPRKPTDKFMPVNSLSDWLLYCKHDQKYLNFKGLIRNINYDWSDFHATDISALWHDIEDIDMNKFGKMAILEDAVEEHRPFYKLVAEGKIPIQFRAQYEAQYLAMVRHIEYVNQKAERKLAIDKKKLKGFTKDEQLSFE